MLTIQIPGRGILDGVVRQVTERVIHPVGHLLGRLLPVGTAAPAPAPAAEAPPAKAPAKRRTPAKRLTPAQRKAAAARPDLRRGDPRVHDLVAELDEAIDAGDGPAIEEVGKRLHALDHNAGAGGDT